MKRVTSTLHLLLIIAISATMMWSCSYTNKTSGAKQFAKKHYNRGIVKIKKTDKNVETDIASITEDEKITKKERKAIVKEQVQAFKDGQYLTASNEEGVVENNEENIVTKIKENLAIQKEKAYAEKETAINKRQSKKADKKIAKLERFESLSERLVEKLSDDYVAPGPEAAAAPADSSLLGLLGGIFGIVGFVFTFAYYLTFLGLLLCIAAIILGVLGLNSSNRGWAIAGIVLGALGLLAFAAAILLFFAFF